LKTGIERRSFKTLDHLIKIITDRSEPIVVAKQIFILILGQVVMGMVLKPEPLLDQCFPVNKSFLLLRMEQLL
jgi:hypothetical protein